MSRNRCKRWASLIQSSIVGKTVSCKLSCLLLRFLIKGGELWANLSRSFDSWGRRWITLGKRVHFRYKYNDSTPLPLFNSNYSTHQLLNLLCCLIVPRQSGTPSCLYHRPTFAKTGLCHRLAFLKTCLTTDLPFSLGHLSHSHLSSLSYQVLA
jgi:hypothetical protein